MSNKSTSYAEPNAINVSLPSTQGKESAPVENATGVLTQNVAGTRMIIGSYDSNGNYIKGCKPCTIWHPKTKQELELEAAAAPNLTIIPMAGIFMFIVLLVIKCIAWCNEDIRLADERFMKISVPNYQIFETGSESPTRKYSVMRRPHRRASLSVAHAKSLQKTKHSTEDETSNTNESSSEEVTVIYNDKSNKPTPAAAAAAAALASHKNPYHRTQKRFMRRQSLQSSSNTTISSTLSSRSPSVKAHNRSFDGSGECSSPSSLGMNPESYLDVTPLIHHSKTAETAFMTRKLSFKSRLLTPPTVHFQLSTGSMETSLTSLGESVPSVASKPSICDSNATEQLMLSEDNESTTNEGSPKAEGGSSPKLQQGGMMFLSGSYYEDPLVLACEYMEVDETVSGAQNSKLFTLGSSNPSLASDEIPIECNITASPDDSSELYAVGNDPCSRGPELGHQQEEILNDTLGEVTDNSSECNSETGLTSELLRKDAGTNTECSSPVVSHRIDPSIYYKLSMESNASTGSLQSPESTQSNDSSLCSADITPLRRIAPSAAFRAVNPFPVRTPHDGKPGRRERISLNGFGHFSQYGTRRIHNGKVMRMCRSWCLGDKASVIYDQLRRGLLEKECYM